MPRRLLHTTAFLCVLSVWAGLGFPVPTDQRNAGAGSDNPAIVAHVNGSDSAMSIRLAAALPATLT